MLTSRLPGALFLTLAFLALTAEGAARSDPAVRGLIVPAIDVMAVLWPERLIGLEVWITRTLGPWAWDPVAVGLLALPAWMTLGGLGVVFLWLSGRRAAAHADLDSGAETHQLFEDLARAAEAEGMRDTDPGMEPQSMLADDITPEPDDALNDDDTADTKATPKTPPSSPA